MKTPCSLWGARSFHNQLCLNLMDMAVATGGIGSRKGRGPTKWGGPPVATAISMMVISLLRYKPVDDFSGLTCRSCR